MGQATPINRKSDRVLSDSEMLAVRHLVWISRTLGPEDEMIAYMTAMLIEQIQTGPSAKETDKNQLALTATGLPDFESAI